MRLSYDDLQAAARAHVLVSAHFGDDAKTALWFETANPLLGGLRPLDLVGLGRHRQLLAFVEQQLAENQRAPFATGCPTCASCPRCKPSETIAQLLHATLRIRELERELAEIKRNGHPGHREDMGH